MPQIIPKRKQALILETLRNMDTVDIGLVCGLENIDVKIADFLHTRNEDPQFRAGLVEVERMLQFSTYEEMRKSSSGASKKLIADRLGEGLLSGVVHGGNDDHGRAGEQLSDEELARFGKGLNEAGKEDEDSNADN